MIFGSLKEKLDLVFEQENDPIVSQLISKIGKDNIDAFKHHILRFRDARNILAHNDYGLGDISELNPEDLQNIQDFFKLSPENFDCLKQVPRLNY